MILSTPNYIITYRAINPRGEWEDATISSPEKDIMQILEKEGFRKIEIFGIQKT